jgi:hypothetical protein
MINTCSPNKGLLRTVVILYYHRKRQAALLSQIYSHGTDRKENTLWTVSNKACIVVPCLVVSQQRSLLPLSKETATVYRVYSCMKNSTVLLFQLSIFHYFQYKTHCIKQKSSVSVKSINWHYAILGYHSNELSTLTRCMNISYVRNY